MFIKKVANLLKIFSSNTHKGDSYHVLIGSEAKRIELYSPEQRLIWAVRTSGGVPISIRLGALRGLRMNIGSRLLKINTLK
jgi:hypothetical protein